MLPLNPNFYVLKRLKALSSTSNIYNMQRAIRAVIGSKLRDKITITFSTRFYNVAEFQETRLATNVALNYVTNCWKTSSYLTPRFYSIHLVVFREFGLGFVFPSSVVYVTWAKTLSTSRSHEATEQQATLSAGRVAKQDKGGSGDTRKKEKGSDGRGLEEDLAGLQLVWGGLAATKE